MLNSRARGIANLHALVSVVGVGSLFWGYSQVIYRIPYVHLSHEVNLIPYFLCAIGGMIVSCRDLANSSSGFAGVRLVSGVRLATREVAAVALLTFAMMFATQDHRISRAFLGSFLVLIWMSLSVLNCWLPPWLAQLSFRKNRRLPTLFVGSAGDMIFFQSWIERRQPLGVDPIGYLSDEENIESLQQFGLRRLGSPRDLETVLSSNLATQVILLNFGGERTKEIIDCCLAVGCRLLIYNNLHERYTQPLVPVAVDGHHFYALQAEPLEDPLNRVIKRAFDMVVSFLVVISILPILCAWVFFMQCLQSPGPLFHNRERKGMHGRNFRMLKFRSMVPSEPDATAEARQAETVDARIFPFGRFMRRVSLDEFPQFWNVFVGEMSIVGPRPYMPLLDQEFSQKALGHRTRHLVKPGITGLAQSLGYRGAVLEDEMIQRRLYWDVHYVSNWSVWLDVQIMLRTMVQVVRPPKTAF